MSKTIIYQLLPRLFGNTDSNRIHNGTIAQNGCGKFNDINSDFLSKLKDEGYTHVWYTGILEHSSVTAYPEAGIEGSKACIVKGIAGSPYAVRDYYDVCADFANDIKERMAEFEQLVKRTHRAGLKCIIDFVPNHVARDYHSDSKPAGVRDFGEDDDVNVRFNGNNNFYYIPGEKFVSPVDCSRDGYTEFPARASGNDVFSASPSINDWYETVKLNYGIDYSNGFRHFNPIPSTWLKMRDILLFWSAKKVDGFRVDMAEMVPVEFWQWVIGEVKEQYPHIQFVAETYNLSLYRQYLSAGFDYLYDKEGFYNCLRSVMQGERMASDICSVWQMNGDVEDRMLLFLENHDEQRLASQFFVGSGKAALPGVLVSALFNRNSALMVYFGQEIGEAGMDSEGFSGRDGRTTIFDYWGIELWQKYVNNHKYDGALLPDEARELREWYVTLLTTIQRFSSLQSGNFYDLTWFQHDGGVYNHRHIYSFLRYDDESRFLVVANFGHEPQRVTLRFPEDVVNQFDMWQNDSVAGIDIFSGATVFVGNASLLSSEGVIFNIAPQTGLLMRL